MEVGGVLNPASARGRDGQLYLFPRLVARGNYSRIGIARVRFNDAGDPVGVEQMGIALEPEADFELRPDGGGCEDPRITFIEPLDRYVMTYTALSSRGPRIALAMSEDLFQWERMGLAIFMPYEGVDTSTTWLTKTRCSFPSPSRSGRTAIHGDHPSSTLPRHRAGRETSLPVSPHDGHPSGERHSATL